MSNEHINEKSVIKLLIQSSLIIFLSKMYSLLQIHMKFLSPSTEATGHFFTSFNG